MVFRRSHIEADPTGVMRGTNHLFTYSRNNPLSYADPLGLVCKLIEDKESFIRRSTSESPVFYGPWTYAGYVQVNLACFCNEYRFKFSTTTITDEYLISKIWECTKKNACGEEEKYFTGNLYVESDIDSYRNNLGRETRRVWSAMYSGSGEGFESGAGCVCSPASQPPGIYEEDR